MFDPKKSLTILGNISLAIIIPWITFKVLRAVSLKKNLRQLVSKVVVITGASSGLGEALAHEFHRNGCLVVLCARRRQELDRVRNDLLKIKSNVPLQEPVIVPLDLCDLDSLPGQVNKILSITGRIDILVNNGGISNRGRVIDTKPEVDLKVMMVNYIGTIALTKAVLVDMVKRRDGQIVFMSSVQGLMALPHRSSYGASKHAMQAFCDSLRAEVAANNITVTILSPGYVKTSLSINALTATGEKNNQLDETQLTGYSAEYAAEVMVKAVALKRNEIVIAPFVPRAAIFLRHFLPSLYFYIMAKRAKKNDGTN